MDAASIFFYLLFFSSMFLITEAFKPKYPTVMCSDSAPDIHFPFWVSTQQSHQSGLPDFQLSCKENTTMIRFPGYGGDLAVKSISYNEKRLELSDPKNCVHQVFLNLNLSETPFRYYYLVKNYTYLNCSTRLSPFFVEVPCLSGSRHHVYTIQSFLSVPISCSPIKTVAIPFSYSPYLADNSFGLGLTWSLPEYEGYAKLLKILLCILAVVMLATIKIYHSKKLSMQIDNDESLLEVLRSKKLKSTGNIIPQVYHQ